MPRTSTGSRAVGKRIRHVREKLGLNQRDFATRLGVSAPAVAQWEAGTVGCKVDHLAAISRLTRVTIDWLYLGPPEKKSVILQRYIDLFRPRETPREAKRVSTLNAGKSTL